MDKPGTRIVKKFGGTAALARALGIAPSTVQHWYEGGIIPVQRIPSVLDAANKAGIEIAYSEFIPEAEGKVT